jgi:hypothetical protein
MKRVLSEREEIGIEIGIPQENPDFADEYYCDFSTFGFSEDIKGRAVGIDEIQAFVNCMMRLDIYLKNTPEFSNGLIFWIGGATIDDFGLPWKSV